MTETTRQKLINAAFAIFAEQGYQDATIQQIVERAGTNIAAVNYHFGDKASFYGEVVADALSKREFTDRQDNQDLSAEEQLRAFISWFIHNAVGIDNQPSFLDQIHMQEMVNPSPMLDTIVKKFIKPNHLRLRAIVSALLPENASEQQIRHHAFSIIGQCLHYKFAYPVMTRLYDDIEFTEDYADVLTEHITNVSLAGMRSARAIT
jgi:AcrR family transcriptional regulator